MTTTMTMALLEGMATMGDRLSRFARRVLDDMQRRQPQPPAPEPIPPAVTEPVPTPVTESRPVSLRAEHRQFCNDALQTLLDTYPIANAPKTHLAVFIFHKYPDGAETIGYGTTGSEAGLRDRMRVWAKPRTPPVVPHLSPVIVPGTRIH